MRLLGAVRSSRRSVNRKLGATTPAKAAVELQVSERELERLVRDGSIHPSKTGGQTRIPFSEIVRFVQAQQMSAHRKQPTPKLH